MTQATLSSQHYADRNIAAAVWRWWLDEMRSVLGQGDSATVENDESRLVVEVSADSVMIRLIGAESERAVLPVTIDDFVSGALNQDLIELGNEATSALLQLGEDDVINTRLSLPKATETELSTVLGFEMDRHTPFNSDQVYFDFDNLSRDARSIAFDLVVVPRNLVDPVLHALNTNGIRIDGVVVGGKRRRNFFPNEFGKTGVSKERRFTASPWLAVSVLALLVISFPAFSLKYYNSKIQAQLTAREQEVATLIESRDRLAQLLGPSEFFQNLRSSTPRAIEVLNELSLSLPDHTWVSGFRMEGNVIQIVGESSDAAGLISLLAQSDFVQDGRFTSSVTRNGSTGKDRYAIELVLSESADD